MLFIITPSPIYWFFSSLILYLFFWILEFEFYCKDSTEKYSDILITNGLIYIAPCQASKMKLFAKIVDARTRSMKVLPWSLF